MDTLIALSCLLIYFLRHDVWLPVTHPNASVPCQTLQYRSNLPGHPLGREPPFLDATGQISAGEFFFKLAVSRTADPIIKLTLFYGKQSITLLTRCLLGIAGSIMAQLDKVWRQQRLSLSTKLRIYTSLV